MEAEKTKSSFGIGTKEQVESQKVERKVELRNK